MIEFICEKTDIDVFETDRDGKNAAGICQLKKNWKGVKMILQEQNNDNSKKYADELILEEDNQNSKKKAKKSKK